MAEIKNIITEAIAEFKLNHAPVMERYYGIKSNGAEPELITEMTLNRLLKKHAKNGMIIISANRSDEKNEYNNQKTRELVKDIRKSQFSYFPVYGGYRGTDDVVDSFEPSFVVVPFDRSGNEMSFEELADFAIEMCGKYNQDSVLIKDPNDVAKYYDRDGQVAGYANDDKPIENDLKQEFFTSLIKSDEIDNDNPERAKRFTYDMTFECYSNPKPATLNEKRRRRSWGEIIL